MLQRKLCISTVKVHHNTEIHFISQLNHGWRGGNWPIQEEFNTKKTSKGVTKLLGAQIPRANFENTDL
jgi:hypothetical protein